MCGWAMGRAQLVRRGSGASTGVQPGTNLATLLFYIYFAAMLIVSVDELAKDDEVTANMVKIEREAR